MYCEGYENWPNDLFTEVEDIHTLRPDDSYVCTQKKCVYLCTKIKV